MSREPDHDPEDLFAHTRMSLGDHIEVLRVHLIRALLGFVVAFCISLLFGQWLSRFIAAPVETELMKFYQRRLDTAQQKAKEGRKEYEMANVPKERVLKLNRRDLFNALGLPEPQVDGGNEQEWVEVKEQFRPLERVVEQGIAQQLLIRPPLLSALDITEGFIVFFKVCAYAAIVMASPWVFWQLWSFIAAGLYPHEKKLVHVYLPISLGLFLAGVCLAEFVVIPKAVEYLLDFDEWMHVEPDLRLSPWLSFALMTPLVFGIAFQTPLIMFFLERIGIVDVSLYVKHRRIAIFILAVIAAFLAAAPDAFNMLALAVPLWCLYELGILLCKWMPRPPSEVPDEDEAQIGV
jgi:sec-independent protein translocase protein TatC